MCKQCSPLLSSFLQINLNSLFLNNLFCLFIFLCFFKFLIDFDGYYIVRTSRGNTSHEQQYQFYARPDVRMEDTSQESFQGSQLPISHKGAVMGKFLNSPYWETV